MDVVLLVARLVLAAVFAVSGAAKLLDRHGARQAVTDFGVTARLAGPIAMVMPLAELAVVAALIPTASAWYGALGALALLVFFSIGIGVNLARGRTPDCHCFGQLHSEPIGWRTLARNGVLAAVAGLVLGFGWRDPGLNAVAWLGDLSIPESVGLVGGVLVLSLVAALGWLVLHLLQQNGRLLIRLERLEAILTPGAEPIEPIPAQAQAGLPVGTPAPAFSLAGLYGETLTLDALRAPSKPVVLLFTDPSCGPCTALLPKVGAWQREHADKLTLAVISRGTATANRAKSSEHGITMTLLQQEREVSDAYKAYGTPSAVLVTPDGTIGSAVAAGAQTIEQLVDRTVGDRPTIPLQPVRASNGRTDANGNKPALPVGQPPRPLAPQVGQDAPALTLTDLDKNPTDLAAYRGQPTLLLFWNPGCGYCQRMLADLKEWEANPPEDAPDLVVVSTGSVEANRAAELRSTILLDQGFAAGRAFGASGTPSAVLVDAKGTIASEVAVGAPAVLELAGHKHPQPSG